MLLLMMVASSSLFLTKISYQTNLMVVELEEILDFLKFGLGLQLSAIAATICVGDTAN